MEPDDERRIATSVAKIMAMICVRNSRLEELHAGQVPVTHIGDHSDVFVVHADETSRKFCRRCSGEERDRADPGAEVALYLTTSAAVKTVYRC